MWKGEAPEIRAKYHQKAQEIKAHLLAMHPNYRYVPRKSSEIRRRAPRQPASQPATPATAAPAQPFQHNAHRSPQANNEKAGLRPTSDITRRIPGAQQFLPPVVTPGWTPYHLLPTPTSPAENTPAAEAPVEEAQPEEILADDGMVMDGGQDFISEVDELINNWNVEADLAQMLGDI
jgi:hypothetical protein